MIALAIESIATVPDRDEGCVYVDYYNVSDELATRAPPKYKGETIDGFVNIYSPERRREGKRFRYGAWPFRTEEKGGTCDETPIWTWCNPDDDIEKITLEPAMVIECEGEEYRFWVHDGFIVQDKHAQR